MFSEDGSWQVSLAQATFEVEGLSAPAAAGVTVDPATSNLRITNTYAANRQVGDDAFTVNALIDNELVTAFNFRVTITNLGMVLALRTVAGRQCAELWMAGGWWPQSHQRSAA